MTHCYKSGFQELMTIFVTDSPEKKYYFQENFLAGCAQETETKFLSFRQQVGLGMGQDCLCLVKRGNCEGKTARAEISRV